MLCTKKLHNYQCGYIAIIGKPNVGKSTLMNVLIGTKISITSRKIQTTQFSINGVHTMNATQFIYIDTPGFQTKYCNKFNSILNKTVISTLGYVDLVLFVIEAEKFNKDDLQVLRLLSSTIPCILVVNKSDCSKNKTRLMSFIQEVSSCYNFVDIVSVSAKQHHKLDDLRNAITNFLPYRLPIFDQNKITDCSEEFLIKEIIREKVFRNVGKELPYTSKVIIEKYTKEHFLNKVFAAIVVERYTHKLIFIGHHGNRLKSIATQARCDIKKLCQKKVLLKIWIKINSN